MPFPSLDLSLPDLWCYFCQTSTPRSSYNIPVLFSRVASVNFGNLAALAPLKQKSGPFKPENSFMPNGLKVAALLSGFYGVEEDSRTTFYSTTDSSTFSRYRRSVSVSDRNQRAHNMGKQYEGGNMRNFVHSWHELHASYCQELFNHIGHWVKRRKHVHEISCRHCPTDHTLLCLCSIGSDVWLFFVPVRL